VQISRYYEGSTLQNQLMCDITFSCPTIQTASENSDCMSIIKCDLERKYCNHRIFPSMNFNMFLQSICTTVLVITYKSIPCNTDIWMSLITQGMYWRFCYIRMQDTGSTHRHSYLLLFFNQAVALNRDIARACNVKGTTLKCNTIFWHIQYK
jgi:hypothetical protein